MSRKGAQRAAKLVPAMRYRDVAAAAEWLCTAFGFEKHGLVKGDDGAVAMAQLTVGATMIMLLPVGGSELDPLMKQPDEIGGVETQKCYLVVDDIDIHYAKAKAGGAQFVLDLKEYENGGRGFSCRDPEGHIWSFGTYDPWDGKSAAPSPPPAAEPMPRGGRGRAVTMAAVVALALGMGAAGWMLGVAQQTAPSAAEETRLKRELTAMQQRVQQAVDRAAKEGAELLRERSAREAIERTAQQAREQLARGEGAKDAAERAAKQMEAQLTEERRAKEAAERAARQAHEELARGASAKEAAERAARQMEAQLTEERRAKEAAERAARTAVDQIARERTAKQAAQNATTVVQKELARARAARQLAERSAKEAGEQLARERAAREAAESAAKDAQVKSGQAPGAEKGITQPASPDRSSKKVSKKSGEPGPAEPMPPLLP